MVEKKNFRKKTVNIDDYIEKKDPARYEKEPLTKRDATPVVEKKEMVLTQSDGTSRVDFSLVINEALKLFHDQSFVDARPEDITLEKIELTRAKATSFLDAIHNVVNITHLQEIVSAEDIKFRRREELSAMNPLLDSFKIAAQAGQKTMQFLIKRLDAAIEMMEDVDHDQFFGMRSTLSLDYKGKRNVYGVLEPKYTEVRISPVAMITEIQKLYTLALSNVNAATAGLSRLIQLERFSGARQWGNGRSGPNSLEYVRGLGKPPKEPEPDDEDEYGNPTGNGTPGKPRKMSSQEIFALAEKRRMEELDE